MRLLDQIVWIDGAGQRLGLVPTLGGGVAAWQWSTPDGLIDLWRPWTGTSDDRYTLASFAMVPWSNRISGGGFTHDGRHYPMRPNRSGERYPIHGDGWLQPWQLERTEPATAVMRLRSAHFDGNPHVYESEQRFALAAGGLDQTLTVTHIGAGSLPYGLGVHPWFARTKQTRVQANIGGVWLSGSDPIPTRHASELPGTWDLRSGAPMVGPLIDNGYTGWDGHAKIRWPERALLLEVNAEVDSVAAGLNAASYCLIYRPLAGDAFCFEPITQPIDAFHLDGRPGLITLAKGESLSLRMRWRVRRE